MAVRATPDDEPTREERKAIYEAVLRTVAAQTTKKQPPGVRDTTLTRILTPPQGAFDIERVQSAIQAARENDELLAWPDDEGRRRLTLANADKLRRVAQWLGERTPEEDEDPLVGWANRMVEEVSDGE